MSARRGVRPARILYCESNEDGTVGGSHQCLLNLVTHLDRTAFEPIIAFYQEHSLLPAFRAVSETLLLESRRGVTWGGSGLHLTAIARRAVNGVRTMRRVLGYVRLLKRRGIDLLHLNNSIVTHHEWLLAAALAGVPCLSHERGLGDRYTAYERWMCRRLALVVPMSFWIRDHMTTHGVAADNMRVMYDGVSPAARVVSTDEQTLRSCWQIQPHQRVFGMVGNIREWKGQEVVVRALTDVVRTHPEVVCFFVGAASQEDAAFEARLRSLIAAADLGRNVRFTGYRDNVPDFVNVMTFVIHASIQPEPFGMVVLEAMAQRKAVIGSRAGGVIEMVSEEETGLTFPPADSKMLAGHIVRLLNDPKLAVEMGRNGYQRLLHKFTLERYVGEMQAAYQSILVGEPAAPIAEDTGPAKVADRSQSEMV